MSRGDFIPLIPAESDVIQGAKKPAGAQARVQNLLEIGATVP